MPSRVLGAALLIGLSVCEANGQKIPDNAFRIGWTETRESRRDQAARWLDEIEAMDRQIPTLSPAEAAWVKVEYDDQLKGNDGRFTARSIRAMDSREFVSREGKQFTTSLLRVLRPLASSRALAEREEMRLWADLAFYALDSNSWGRISRLGELGILARDPKQQTDRGHQAELMAYWAHRVQAIAGQILEPYLRRDE